MGKKLTMNKIAAELTAIRRELIRLAADTSPTKDGAKALYEAYKKKHPNTEKTVQDFYEPKESGKNQAEESVEELTSLIPKNNPAKKSIETAMGRLSKKIRTFEGVVTPMKPDEFNYKIQDVYTEGVLKKKGMVRSVAMTTSVEDCTFTESVVGFHDESKVMKAEKSNFKKCTVSVSEAYKSTFADSEIVVFDDAVFESCTFKKGTKIVGDPKAMVFVDPSFEDQDYMEELMDAGAQFVNSEDFKDAISEKDKYLNSRGK